MSVIIFESPLLELERQQEKNLISLEQDRGVKQTGIYTCGKCGGNEHYITVMQTRSGDEGPTTFAQCTKCNFCFKEGR